MVRDRSFRLSLVQRSVVNTAVYGAILLWQEEDWSPSLKGGEVNEPFLQVLSEVLPEQLEFRFQEEVCAAKGDVSFGSIEQS